MTADPANFAAGLDLAGYSSGSSGLALARRLDGGDLQVALITGHVFSERFDGRSLLGPIAEREIRVLQALMAAGPLCVDVTIDLEDLPMDAAPRYVWQLTRRPVEMAFGAMPPLADRIGAPVARMRHLWKAIGPDPLGKRLYETYPAASLELQGLTARSYKGAANWRARRWQPAPAKSPAERRRHDTLAGTLHELAWTAAEPMQVNHDLFDAAVCALTGLAPAADRLEGDALARVMNDRLRAQGHVAADDRQPLPLARGIVLLANRLRAVHLELVDVDNDAELLDAIADFAAGAAGADSH